ncbi:MAG: hypothetical protein SGILL_000566 [Bacillariaceae sp.]
MVCRISSSANKSSARRRPSTGKHVSKAPRQTSRSPQGTARKSTPSSSGSPKRDSGKSGVAKGYVSKGPTYSSDLKAEDFYRNVPKSKWSLTKQTFAGAFKYDTIGKQEQVNGRSINKAIETFKNHPETYVAIMFQDDLKDWPGVSKRGWMTIMVQQYQHLPACKDNILPKQYRDSFTDAMVHHRKKIHSKNNPPILPGRGMGVGDTPLLKLIGDIDPSDIHQGSVGDCWLLSAISALAEFDGAIKKLFRKTKNLDCLPLETPNTYTVTLWNLQTWKEVDIVMDERLAAKPDGSGLLASKPSEDGELWVCYLEKAFAIHCPHDNMSDMWRVAWPKVGGGGGTDLELTEDQLFERMFAYDKHDYIVAAGTNGTSDKHLTDGMVDNHAYSVIEAHSFGKVKLFKVRNPWGKGEIENGEFDDDGPGWDRHPKIKAVLKPVVADDGVFYLTQSEFFKLFDHIYVSAQSMSEFLED